jgi:hypothetical protein
MFAWLLLMRLVGIGFHRTPCIPGLDMSLRWTAPESRNTNTQALTGPQFWDPALDCIGSHCWLGCRRCRKKDRVAPACRGT